MQKIEKLVTVTSSKKIVDKKTHIIFDVTDVDINWDNVKSFEPHPNGTLLVLDINQKLFVSNQYAASTSFGSSLKLMSVQDIHSKVYGLISVKQICGVRGWKNGCIKWIC